MHAARQAVQPGATTTAAASGGQRLPATALAASSPETTPRAGVHSQRQTPPSSRAVCDAGISSPAIAVRRQATATPDKSPTDSHGAAGGPQLQPSAATVATAPGPVYSQPQPQVASPAQGRGRAVKFRSPAAEQRTAQAQGQNLAQHLAHEQNGGGAPAVSAGLFGVPFTPGAPVLLGPHSQWWRENTESRQAAAQPPAAVTALAGISQEAFAAAVQAVQVQEAAAAEAAALTAQASSPVVSAVQLPQLPPRKRSGNRITDEDAAEVLLSLQAGGASPAKSVPSTKGTTAVHAGAMRTRSSVDMVEVLSDQERPAANSNLISNGAVNKAQHAPQAEQDDEATESDIEPAKSSAEAAGTAGCSAAAERVSKQKPAVPGVPGIQEQTTTLEKAVASLPASAQATAILQAATGMGVGNTAAAAMRKCVSHSSQSEAAARQEATMRELEQAVVSLPADVKAHTAIRGQAAVMALAVLRDQAALSAHLAAAAPQKTPPISEPPQVGSELVAATHAYVNAQPCTQPGVKGGGVGGLDMLLTAASTLDGKCAQVVFTRKAVHLQDEDAPDLRNLPGSTSHTTVLAQALAAWGFQVVLPRGRAPVATAAAAAPGPLIMHVPHAHSASAAETARSAGRRPAYIAQAKSDRSQRSVRERPRARHYFRPPLPRKVHPHPAPRSVCVTTGTAELSAEGEKARQSLEEPQVVAPEATTTGHVAPEDTATPEVSTGAPPPSDPGHGADMMYDILPSAPTATSQHSDEHMHDHSQVHRDIGGADLEHLLAHGITPVATHADVLKAPVPTCSDPSQGMILLPACQLLLPCMHACIVTACAFFSFVLV